MTQPLAYKRVLLKLSGEILAGDQGLGIDTETLATLVDEIKEVHQLGLEIGVVVGGGNICRGIEISGKNGIERSTGDYMGMLATTINALAFQDALESKGVDTRVMTAIEMHEIAEPYIRRRAHRHLEKRRVIIFAGGTGRPYFTTDTAASLRAMEISADLLLKGTNVDAIYDSDPDKNPDAKPYSELSFMDVLRDELAVMDAAAISLCKENNMPIRVFNIGIKGNLQKIVSGERIGTFVQ